MAEPLVIVGNGMAATRFVEELCERAPGRYAITVIGEEPQLAYNRVLLSSVLAKESRLDDLTLKPAPWWHERGVALRYGCAASAVDPHTRMVTLADGTALSFSKLVLATGSKPIRLPLPGARLSGVIAFRDIADVETMSALARPGARVAVIGGGLLGLEAAYGLNKLGAKVTLGASARRFRGGDAQAGGRIARHRGTHVRRVAMHRRRVACGSLAPQGRTSHCRGCGRIRSGYPA